MAYTPGAKLGYMAIGFQNAVVLSENKVMCTSGTYAGQTMLLVDWLILACNKEQQENTAEEADEVWTHAKQKAGIEPPSLARVDLPQLLVPPCCDTEYACGCLELSAAPPAPPAAPEPVAQSHASHLPEPAAASPSTSSKVPELRFPPPLEALPQRYFGDKVKWELNDETYRIAVFTKKGVFEVKNVEDGGAAVHNKDCTCSPCRDYKMVPRAPWQPRLPLAKTFFADEAAWRATLPQGGKFYTKKVDRRYNDWV
jgi:hypothetical protein